MAKPLTEPKRTEPREPGPGYDDDFLSWTAHQAKLLRAGRFDLVDVENLATEIEDLGKRDRREVASRLEVLMAHLLKWQFQPRMRSGSWRGTIRTQRNELLDVLRDSPSLRQGIPEQARERYLRAVERAASETGLAPESFPQALPYSADQLLDEDFFPEEA